MIDLLPDVELPRPAPAADAGPLDDAPLRPRRDPRPPAVRRQPGRSRRILGIHTEDHRLGDPSRDAVLERDRRRPRAPRGGRGARRRRACRPTARFERDLEIHNLRLGLFEADEIRRWERRSTAAGEIGDARVPAVRPRRGAARRAPRADRRPARARRRRSSSGSKTRRVGPQVAVVAADVEAALRRTTCPALFAEVRGGGRRRPRRRDARPPRPRDRGRQRGPRGRTAPGCARRSTDATDDWPLGARALRRAASGCGRSSDLDADAILAIGQEQLRREPRGAAGGGPRARPGRRPARRVIDRVKSDHPATFEEALDGYRDVDAPGARLPHRARHRRRSPTDEHDRGHRRRPSTCARSCRSPRTTRPPGSTPTSAACTSSRRRSTTTRTRCASTTGRRSRTRASTRRTRATTSSSRSPSRHPSLTRMLTDAPEFVEGWGMYSEQMMREEGFDDGPAFRVGHVHRRDLAGVPDHPRRPDAPRRADARRGDRLPRRAHGRSRPPNARAEVRRYTYTPGYQLSYLLGKVLILGLREDERRRRGDGFSLKAFHDTLLRNGSHPDQLPPPPPARRGLRRMDVIPAIDVEAGRSRVVYWPGAVGRASARRPTARTGSRSSSSPRARGSCTSSTSTARSGQRRPTSRPSARSRPGSPSRSSSRAGSRRPTTCGSRSPPAPRASCSRSRSSSGPTRSRGVPRGRRRLARRRPRPAAGAARRVPVAARRDARRSTRSSRSSSARGVRRLVLSHGGTAPGRRRSSTRSSGRHDADILVAGGATDLDGVRRLRDAGVAGVILGEALLSGAIDFPRALEAAA